MTKKYYHKTGLLAKKNTHPSKRVYKWIGIVLLTLGLSLMSYYTFPVFIWEVIFKSSFAKTTSPIPPPFILTPEVIHAVEKEQTAKVLSQHTKASLENSDSWLNEYKFKESIIPSISSYTISIPELEITNAQVSTEDFDLSKHLVQYWGTPIPPLQGNTVIFGHSTLPHLFEKNNYKTIFAHAHSLKNGDLIYVHLNDENYTYKVVKSFITTPSDLSVLSQDREGNYLTIVTCTPPGTTWKRLIIRARLVDK